MRSRRQVFMPQQGGALLRGHPLANGLANFYTLAGHLPQCLVTGNRGTPYSTRPQLQGSSIGIGMKGSESSTTYVDVPVVAYSGASVAVTYIFGIVPSGNAQSVEQRVFDNAVSDNTTPKVTSGVSANTVRFFSNSAGGTPNGSITATLTWSKTPQLHCVVYDYSRTTNNGISAGTTLWVVNGIPQSISSVVNGEAGGAQDPATVRLLGIAAAPRGVDAVMLYWGKYGRGLSIAEAVAMTTRPWQILSTTPRVWHVPSAAAFNVAWAVGANTVVQSGARAA